jgi:hypothetical protein
MTGPHHQTMMSLVKYLNIKSTLGGPGGIDVRAGGDKKQIINFAASLPSSLQKRLGTKLEIKQYIACENFWATPTFGDTTPTKY